jgi:putative CocE/NonD family hydrolase
MGENVWQSAMAFPPAGLMQDTLYLHPDQTLQFYPSASSTASSQIVYDPRNPSPTHGGATLRQDLLQGPYDQSDVVESRDDILIFSTDVLPYDVKFIGKSLVRLYVSSDRLDTDFTIRLTDVYPDGRSMLLAEGVQRMRFRDGFTANDTSAMVPGTIYEINIPLPHTSNTFLAGHRFRIDVASSNYPRFDSNLNNGGVLYAAGDTLVATNQIFHDLSSPSALIFQTDKINGIAGEDAFPWIAIFPNPATDRIQLAFRDRIKPGTSFSLCNVLGEKMHSATVPPSGIIDVSRLSAGVYFLQITQGAHRRLDKIVINR